MSRSATTSCLFCLGDASGSQSRSHIVPEALGNGPSALASGIPLILSPGVVCDKCNHGFGRRVESNVMANEFVGMFATFKGIPGKRGRRSMQLPGRSRLSVNGGPAKVADRLRVTPSRVSDAAPRGNEPIEINVTTKFRTNPHLMSAWLSKMLVEYTAHVVGRETALHEAFDHHRTNALMSTSGEFLPYYVGRWNSDGFELFLDPHKSMRFEFRYHLIRYVMPLPTVAPERLPVAPGLVLWTPGGARGTL